MIFGNSKEEETREELIAHMRNIKDKSLEYFASWLVGFWENAHENEKELFAVEMGDLETWKEFLFDEEQS